MNKPMTVLWWRHKSSAELTISVLIWPSGKLPIECQTIAKNLTFFKKNIAKNFHFFKKKLPFLSSYGPIFHRRSDSPNISLFEHIHSKEHSAEWNLKITKLEIFTLHVCYDSKKNIILCCQITILIVILQKN